MPYCNTNKPNYAAVLIRDGIEIQLVSLSVRRNRALRRWHTEFKGWSLITPTRSKEGQLRAEAQRRRIIHDVEAAKQRAEKKRLDEERKSRELASDDAVDGFRALVNHRLGGEE